MKRVFGLRRVARWWYARRIERELQEKEVLKTRLDEKIDELKDKSDYYNTQKLLEQYDSKSIPKNPPKPPEKLRDHPPLQQPISSKDHLQQQHSANLRQRVPSNIPLPPLPPITPSTFATSPNIPQFHPSAFSPPPSPSLPPEQHKSKTFLDRVLDLVVGEDENSADHRYALICRHCRAHNGLAPPGERADEVGYLCGRCGGWNGPEPNKQKEKPGAEKSKESGTQGGAMEKKSAENVGVNINQNKVREGQGDQPQE